VVAMFGGCFVTVVCLKFADVLLSCFYFGECFAIVVVLFGGCLATFLCGRFRSSRSFWCLLTCGCLLLHRLGMLTAFPSFGYHPGLGGLLLGVGFECLGKSFAWRSLVLTTVAFLNIAHLVGGCCCGHQIYLVWPGEDLVSFLWTDGRWQH
jgi:hypothetical protein